MSQASITKSYHLSSACRRATTYIKSLVKHWPAPTVYMIENDENFMSLIWLPTTPIFSEIFGVGGVRIKVIKKVVSLQYTMRSCKQKLPTHDEKHHASAPFPQNNIFMDISPYETLFSTLPWLLFWLPSPG